MMRAWVSRSEGFCCIEVPRPSPQEGEVLIKVAAFGINRADWLQRKGHYDPPSGASPLLGLEVSGIICALGPGVPEEYLGLSCMALLSGGGYAQYAVAPWGHVLPVPESWDALHAAACMENFITAHEVLIHRAGLKPGEKVLIHAAASGVGTSAIQCAHALGAQTYGTVRQLSKVDRLYGMGVLQVLDGHTFLDEPFLDLEWDVILDVLGASALSWHLEHLRPGGRMACIALMQGKHALFDMTLLLKKKLCLFGFNLRHQSREEKTQVVQRWGDFLKKNIHASRLLPVLDSVYETSELDRAFERMESNQNFGKMVAKVE